MNHVVLLALGHLSYEQALQVTAAFLDDKLTPAGAVFRPTRIAQDDSRSP